MITRRRDVESDEEELDMTPMIDMTFLLLIFFMVTTVIESTQNPELPEAVAGDTEKVDQQVVLVLDFQNGIDAASAAPLSGAQVTSLSTARIFLQGKPDEKIPGDQLENSLRQEFSRRKTGELILQASRKMPASVVREVLQVAKRAGATRSSVAVWVPR